MPNNRIGRNNFRNSTSREDFEIIVLIERYLENGHFNELAAQFRDEINRRDLVPRRVNFYGQQHRRTYEDFIRLTESFITLPRLSSILERLRVLNDAALPPSAPDISGGILVSAGNAIDRTPTSIQRRSGTLTEMCRNPHELAEKMPFPKALALRALTGLPMEQQLIAPVLSRAPPMVVKGHDAAIYCVTFDRSGRYVITGADDGIVKCWDVELVGLRFSFRGHTSAISDLSVSYCNTMLASCSVDKSVRIWCMQSGRCIKMFPTHTAQVTTIQWLPYTTGSLRWAVTTGWDCCVNFYGIDTFGELQDSVVTFMERDIPGIRLFSAISSPGGRFVAVGDSHSRIRMFRMNEDGPTKITELSAHKDRIDSLTWAHNGMCFASGSHDGVARVWSVETGRWRSVALQLSKEELAHSTELTSSSQKRQKYKITMLCWSRDDTRVITAGNDKRFRIWDAQNGTVLFRMEARGICYVLRTSPIHPNLLYTSDHEGFISLWDIDKGILLEDLQLHSALFDMDVSSDGTRIAVSDSAGAVYFLGFDCPEKPDDWPTEQFFVSDFHGTAINANLEVVDAETGIPFHLQPPEFLTSGDALYPEEWQVQIVPGREQTLLNGDQLSCPWLTRDIMPPISKEECAFIEERNRKIGELEVSFYDEEMAKEPEAEQPAAEAKVPPSNRPAELLRSSRAETLQRITAELQRRDDELRARRERARRRGLGQTRAPIPARRRLRVNEPPSTDEPSDRADITVESREFDIDSTYGEDLTSSDSSDETESDEEEDEGVNGEPEESAIQERSDYEDAEDEDMEPVPGTSSDSPRRLTERQAELQRRKAEKKAKEEASFSRRSNNAPRQHNRSTRRISTNPSDADRASPVLPKFFTSFPTAYAGREPRRSPYFAQTGDSVVYFKQGHQMYLNAIERSNIYTISPKMLPRTDLDAEEFAFVDDVSYTLKPFRLTVLTLAQIDRTTNARTGISWTVKYHDCEHIADFVILRHIFDACPTFREGDQIEAVLDNCWWTGRVIKKAPFDANFPRSNWCSLQIKYDTGEEDQLSPWELQRKTPHRRSEDEVTQEELRLLAKYEPVEGDWPKMRRQGSHADFRADRDASIHRLRTAIASLESDPVFAPFVDPVDITEYPRYPQIVDYPSDLTTINERLYNQFYRRLEAVHNDLFYIAHSAGQFNKETEPIVHNAQILAESLIRYSSDPSLTDLTVVLEQVTEMSRRDLLLTLRNRRKKKKDSAFRVAQAVVSNGIATQSEASTWQNSCITVLNAVGATRYGQHFAARTDQDPMASIWQSCGDVMSLSEMTQALNSGRIESIKQLLSNIKNLVEAVCFAVNDHRSAIYRDSYRFLKEITEDIEAVAEQYQETPASNRIATLQARNRRAQMDTRSRRPLRVATSRYISYREPSVENTSSDRPGPLNTRRRSFGDSPPSHPVTRRYKIDDESEQEDEPRKKLRSSAVSRIHDSSENNQASSPEILPQRKKRTKLSSPESEVNRPRTRRTQVKKRKISSSENDDESSPQIRRRNGKRQNYAKEDDSVSESEENAEENEDEDETENESDANDSSEESVEDEEEESSDEEYMSKQINGKRGPQKSTKNKRVAEQDDIESDEENLPRKNTRRSKKQRSESPDPTEPGPSNLRLRRRPALRESPLIITSSGRVIKQRKLH